MEFQFNKTDRAYLRTVVSQEQTQEQTQEIRLPDGMPDIGRVLGCWGQPLIRSKEWHSDGMTVTGGVLAWALYLPEDGTEARSVDAWIPFQMKWDFPETKRDGSICTTVRLRSMDGRSTSARRLMLRCNVGIFGEALEPTEAEVYEADSVPQDVQMLRRSYPMELPREAGEKSFQLDEELTLPESSPKVRKILYFQLEPQITEQKIMAGKLVFRGECRLHLLYSAEDGSLHTWDTTVPFSQYADLDQEHEEQAQVSVHLMTTGAELDRDEEGRLLLKCSFVGQYRIYDRVMVELVEDAYSPTRTLELQSASLRLPVRLDSHKETLAVHQSLRAEGERCIDCTVLWDHASCRQQGEAAQICVPAQYQVLYIDGSGSLQGSSGRFESLCDIPSDRGNRTVARIAGMKLPECRAGQEGMELSGELSLELDSFSEQELPMVTGIRLGDTAQPDPDRPALILRKLGDGGLWDLAKSCGSTVEAIEQANHLTQEPAADQFLLIPVYN